MAKQYYQKRNQNPILFPRQFKTPAAQTKKSQEKSSDAEKWLGLTLILFLLSGTFIILISLLGEYGVLAFQDLKQNEQQLNERIQILTQKEQKLLQEIDALKNNPDYIEALARKELGLIRKDEVIYFLPCNPSPQKSLIFDLSCKSMKLLNLIQGRFLKRYKRFFVDVELLNGKVVTAHCNNTGSMKSLLHVGCPVWVQSHDDPKRKLKYSLHLMQMPTGAHVCVNTLIPNQIVFEAIENDKLSAFRRADSLKKEVTFGQENSRVDLYLEQAGKPTFIEIKNTTLVEDMLPGVAQFPDAVTERGRKHLNELKYEANKGHRAVILYLVNRSDCNIFKVAEPIDPLYANALQDALKCGVEIQIYKSRIEISQQEALIEIKKPLKMAL